MFISDGMAAMGNIAAAIVNNGFTILPQSETCVEERFIKMLLRHTPSWYIKDCDYIIYPNYCQYRRKTMYLQWPCLRTIVRYQLYDVPRLKTSLRYTLYGKVAKHRRFTAAQLAQFVEHHNGGQCRLFAASIVLDNPKIYDSLAIYSCATKTVIKFEKKLN